MELITKYFNELSIEELYEVLLLRAQVFVVEQNCIYNDLDDLDKNSVHILLKDNDKLVAYCRLIMLNDNKGKIGRVVSLIRNKGFGSIVVKQAIDIAINEFKMNNITLDSQVQAKNFYKKLGFVCVGEEFLEDGIAHIKMILK